MKENIKEKAKDFADNNKAVKFATENFNKVKTKYKEQEPKKQKLILLLIVGIIVFSVGLTIFLNTNSNSYVVLYENIQPTENQELLASLQAKQVPVKTNSEGSVMVQKKDYNKLLLDLTKEGHPKTAPAYGIFKDNSGFTTTEFEKRQYLIFNLQNEIRKTLKGLDGVQDASVQIVVPDDVTYVLEDSKTKATAAVSITMRPGFKLSPAKVTSIRNLVGFSVPKMDPKNVAVIDARTGVTMTSDDSQVGSGFDRLGFETQVEQKLNEKVKNVLSLSYLPDDIRVSSTVVIDYDKMITEEMDYVPGENGEGVKEHFEEYIENGGKVTGGIVGEENNTDIPTYPNTQGDNNGNYQQKADYLVSYIKKQIEKDQAVLKDASIAVTVKDEEMEDDKIDTLSNTIAKATNINPDNISIASLGGPKLPTMMEKLQKQIPLLLGCLLLILLALAVFMFIKNKKKKASEQVAEGEFSEVEVKQDLSLKLKQELEEEKRKIIANAEANKPITSAVTEDIRGFVDENPEISASLIRSWLNEED